MSIGIYNHQAVIQSFVDYTEKIKPKYYKRVYEDDGQEKEVKQTVVACVDGKYLVWYKCSESGNLNGYWINRSEYEKKFRRVR